MDKPTKKMEKKDMNKQAYLEEVYTSAFNDELEKSAACSPEKKREISSLIDKEFRKSSKDLGLSEKHKKTLFGE